MPEVIRYKHYANAGDLIASMAVMKFAYEQLGKKAVIQQELNIPAHYYEGATHPIVDSKGTMVCINEKQWEMLMPLLRSQEYVADCEIWEGQETDIDLNKIRDQNFANIPYTPIEIWQFMAYPELTCDISLPWLRASKCSPDLFEGKVIINRTERYHNHQISYYFLKEYEDICLFIGTEKEHEVFNDKFKLNIQRYVVGDFGQLAQVVSTAKFTLCNQSMIYNICNGLKVPRLLEMCRYAPNCFPLGKGGFGFLHQFAIEKLFKKLIK